MTTTRITQRFRDHLFKLRSIAYELDNNADCDALVEAIDLLGLDMAMKFPVTEEVELPTEAA